MKTSSFVTLICSLAVSGFNTFHQPAMAEGLPQSGHVKEAVIGETNKSDSLVVAQKG